MLLMAGVLFAMVAWRGVVRPPSKPVDAPSGPAAPTTPTEVSADERMRRAVVGRWQDHYQGTRTMTLRADGTGEMLVELQGMSAVLFADKLRFRLTWSIASGVFHERSLDGEPAAKVQLILKTFGDHADQKILALEGDEVQLLDADGKTRYQWKRLPEDGAPPAAPR